MGQCSPKGSSKELHSSIEDKNKIENDTIGQVKTKVQEDKRRNKMLLSPEKARDTATWIMTTW